MSELLLHANVPGKPRPQGSLSLWRAPDGTERAKNPDHMVAHRNLMVGTLRGLWGLQRPWLGPVALNATFYVPRPKGHFGTGRNEGLVKQSAPLWPVGYPDTDKLVRLVGDALTIAGIIRDDAQLVRIVAVKQWEPDMGNGHTTLVLTEVA